MKPADVRWQRNPWNSRSNSAGWDLYTVGQPNHLGTVFADGSWYAVGGHGATRDGVVCAGSQPLAAQALLRAAGVEP